MESIKCGVKKYLNLPPHSIEYPSTVTVMCGCFKGKKMIGYLLEFENIESDMSLKVEIRTLAQGM